MLTDNNRSIVKTHDKQFAISIARTAVKFSQVFRCMIFGFYFRLLSASTWLLSFSGALLLSLEKDTKPLDGSCGESRRKEKTPAKP